MGIFNSSDQEANGTSQTTIIAEGTQMKGEIDIKTPLSIFGKFTGSIRSKSVVTIGSKGFAAGDISALKLVINGAFDGDISCQTIEILENGVAKGSIETSKLIIEEGGFFEGESKKMDSTKANSIALSNSIIDTDTEDNEKITDNQNHQEEDKKKTNKGLSKINNKK